MGSHAPAPTSAHPGIRPQRHVHTFSSSRDNRAPAPTAERAGARPERHMHTYYGSTGSRSLWPRRVAGRTRKTHEASVASLRFFSRVASWRTPPSRAIPSPRVRASPSRFCLALATQSTPRPQAAPRGAGRAGETCVRCRRLRCCRLLCRCCCCRLRGCRFLRRHHRRRRLCLQVLRSWSCLPSLSRGVHGRTGVRVQMGESCAEVRCVGTSETIKQNSFYTYFSTKPRRSVCALRYLSHSQV
jgi:hypothetical protein